jgi:hypothetical protein
LPARHGGASSALVDLRASSAAPRKVLANGSCIRLKANAAPETHQSIEAVSPLDHELFVCHTNNRVKNAKFDYGRPVDDIGRFCLPSSENPL